MTELEKKYLKTEPMAAWGSFFILLATYWLTVAPTVSFWDCPEYVAAADLLEIGHPPGNPTWMLAERIVTMLVPAGYEALAVNLSSGLFTAFAAFFLAKTIFRVGLWVLLKMPRRAIPAPLAAAGAALTGALFFGWCDSVWFSAVEAEVYAMSIFMTSLCLWLMAKWAGTRNRGDSWRLLVLIAYIFGLSIGVHQLNLLCIPALALIWAIRRGIRNLAKIFFIFLLSCILVACILTGMMPSTIALASRFELLAVNRLNLPALSGVAIYLLLLGASLLAAMVAIARSGSRYLMALACFPSIFLSGIFIISNHFMAGALVSALAAVLLVTGSNFKVRRLYLSMWMLAMLLTGYSSYAIIPVRGSVASPANAAMPDNPFSFASYQSREQYGSTPLLYGPTPYSKALMHEEFDENGKARYNFYELRYDRPLYVPKSEGMKLKSQIRGLSAKDSLENKRLLEREGDAYIVRGVHAVNVKTPELNMWFPRITGSGTHDLEAYADWIGMDSSTMVKVSISEAVDSDGNFVAKMTPEGKRGNPYGLRPTYLQNLQWLAVYQTSYMYWRYLLWNFAGRQNDRPAQGEVQHGNFITGIPVVDNAMLGADDMLPEVAGSGNKGRNRYFGLPLLLGLAGIVWLLTARRRGRLTCGVNAVLFFMTGLAITLYLNQGPGEPRERDYSFLGSYLAFSIWIAFGAVMTARWFKSAWGFLLPLALAGWMCYENYDDHDRSGQLAAREFGRSVLNSAEPDAIIFVYGDNYTFPLWYMQEVEGIRRDVRVVNLSYLSSGTYASNLLSDWRESKALNTVLQREDIAGDAFRMAKVPSDNSDTLPAVEALKGLRLSKNCEFPSRYVYLDVSPDSTIVYDLRNLTSGGGNHTDFGKLMMFDIIAGSSPARQDRPVYWISSIGAERRIGLTSVSSPWIFGFKYGLSDISAADSLMLDASRKITAPNVHGKDVYMDHAPSLHVGLMRGALVNAGQRMLANGKLTEAIEIAVKADVLTGDGPDSYGNILVGDSIFNVRLNLGRLLVDCADSLQARITAAGITVDRYRTARIIELKARGQMHLNEYTQRMHDWQKYREALPPRLRGKMSPVY